MKQKVYTIEELKELVIPVIIKYNVDKLYLFGSYARGNATENSDLDFLVDASRIPGIKFFSFCEDLEKVIGKSVDVVEIEALEDGDELTQMFYNEIKKEVIELYAN